MNKASKIEKWTFKNVLDFWYAFLFVNDLLDGLFFLTDQVTVFKMDDCAVE